MKQKSENKFTPSYLCPKCGQWHWDDKCPDLYTVTDKYGENEESVRAYSSDLAAERYVEEYYNSNHDMDNDDTVVIIVTKNGGVPTRYEVKMIVEYKAKQI